MTSFTAALTGPGRPLTLDGGLATELERRGHDLSGRLWSARLLHDEPAAIRAAHAGFRAAGADVLTTASYQAATEGLAAAGWTPAEARTLLTRSVDLAREAADGAWVAGSVGPYGAMLADGSEYTGDYGDDVDEARLRAFHRPRLEILAGAGVDVLAAETVPSGVEAAALIAELDRLGAPAWLSLTTATGSDGVPRTRRGEPAEAVFALAEGVAAIVAVGVNCMDPAGVGAAVEVAARASGKPVVVYPNSGEGWDAGARSWTGTATGFGEGAVTGWVHDGARAVGGCCRVSPEMVTRIHQEVAHPSY